MLPIFVKMRRDDGRTYDSYDDYWSLVALAGFPTCEIKDIDLRSTNQYVVSPHNGNILPTLMERERRCRLILWHLERGHPPDGYDEIWASDRWFADRIGARYVVLGGHPALPAFNGAAGGQPKVYDAVHLAYINRRRQRLLARVQHLKLAPDGLGRARDEALHRTRVGICWHQDDQPIIEPLRYMLFSCFKLPLFAEYSNDPYPYLTHPHDHIDPTETRHNYKTVTEEFLFKDQVLQAIGG